MTETLASTEMLTSPETSTAGSTETSTAVAPPVHRDAVVTTTMHASIADTLTMLRALPSPVVRSGHVGNNTSNIWGWLALAGNAQLAQVDHNLYGVDEVCLPWMVLGDGGRIDAVYGLDGQPVPEQVGEHATAARATVPRKHYAHLALGLAAEHAGRDLMAYHFDIADRLSQRMNGSRATCDALVLLELRSRLVDLARALHGIGRLDQLFDRYIVPTKRGHLTQLKLGPITTEPGGDLRLVARDGRALFRGSLDALLDQLFNALEGIAQRLTSSADAERPANLPHPWITSAMGYFAITLAELEVDPRREVFWHGGGSTSQYYIHADATRREYTALRDLLASLGFVPDRWHLRIVPTYCCQLFATTDDGLTALEALLAVWQEGLERYRPAVDRAIDTLATTTEPLPVVRELLDHTESSWQRTLRRHLEAFNRVDPNVLPVAHAAGHGHPTYNKYGLAQHRLLTLTPRFPRGLIDLTWGEAELLVKVLAELDLDRLG